MRTCEVTRIMSRTGLKPWSGYIETNKGRINLTSAEVVRLFFEKVRSGRELDAVHSLMADQIFAHQITSENLEGFYSMYPSYR